MKILIQIFLDNRIITGIKQTNVPTMQINETIRLLPKKRLEIINAATANAIPTA
jgi:hypothetical protein